MPTNAASPYTSFGGAPVLTSQLSPAMARDMGIANNPNYKWRGPAAGGIGGGYEPVTKEEQVRSASLDAQMAQANALKGLYGAMGSGGGGSITMPSMGGFAGGTGGSGGVTPGPQIPQVQAPDMTAANNAAYGSAKDKVGNAARGALTSLNDELGAAGMLGSGAQVKGTEDVINQGQQELGETARGQARKQADLSADFAKTGYQGAITQRGQDINSQEANARLALESRQQYMQMLQAAMSGLKGSIGGGSEDALY
jgi:hypothetical protein